MATQNTQGFALGAYLGNPNGSSASGEAAFESDYASFQSLMGMAPTYLNNYVDYTQTMANWAGNAGWQAWSDAQSPDARGVTPVIALPMASIAAGAPSADAQYKAIASGADDSVYQGIVSAYVANGYTNLVFRPGWEMNIQGNTYAGDTAQDQADWVSAYQHIYTVLHQEASALGVNVTVVWNPSVTNYSNVQALTTLYPGDAYVDAIGADVYSDIHPYSDGNNAAGQPTYHDWDTGGEDTSIAQFIADPVNRDHYWSDPAATKWSNDSSGGHATSLTQIIQFAEQHGKSFSIPETGAGNASNGTDVSDDAAFPQWLAGQLATATAQGEAIGFVSLWDSNGDGSYEFSKTSDDKPTEAAAWAKYFGTAQPAVAAQTAAPSRTLGSGSDTITLQMAEDYYNGDAQFTVAVDGQQVGGVQTAIASHAAGQTQTFNVDGNFGPGQHTVAIDFLNDAWGGSAATDRNLYLAGSSYDGVAQPGSLTLGVSGMQTLTVTAPSQQSSSAASSTNLGSGSDTIALQMAEDYYNGNAQFTVAVDGQQVGGVQTAIASHAAGQTQTFNVNGNFGPGQHSVAIDFLNDAWGGSAATDRNLYLAGSSYDGVAQPGSLTLDSSGTQALTVTAPSQPSGATTLGSGSDTVALQMAEDYYNGNAQFTVAVDGQQVGGVQTAVASHAAGQTQTFNVDGNFGPGQHTVAIDFLNDAWGGSAATDRNLYLAGSSYDGVAQPGSLTLGISGTQTQTVTSATTYTPGAAGGSITTLGNDTVTAGSGAVTVQANGPSVNVTGGTGTLTFLGHQGNDTVTAGSGTATISGGGDILTFIAGSGNASITAGSGPETFDVAMGKAGGMLTIAGFTPGQDVVHLAGYAGNGILSQSVTGGSTAIVLTDHTTINLPGAGSLSAHSIFGT